MAALREAPRSYEDLCIEVAELRGQLKTAKATAAHQYRKPLEDARAENMRLRTELKLLTAKGLRAVPRTYTDRDMQVARRQLRDVYTAAFDGLGDIPRKDRKRRQWREEARAAIYNADKGA